MCNCRYREIFEIISKHNVIIIHRHSRPDGDALGSQIGLKEAIKATFPEKEVYVVGDYSSRYSFIGELDEIEDCKYTNALAILLDSSDSSLLSDTRYKFASTKIKFDHHIFKEKYADYEIIDTSFESCCGLLADFIFETGMKLTTTGAKALFAGMVTDSGRFRYDSTNAKTFYLASKLYEYNFDVNDIYNSLYVEDYEVVKLRAKFVMKFALTECNVAYIKTTKEEVKELGVDIFTISRGMVNTMAGIKGIDIWVNFTEDEENNCIITEIRSSKYTVVDIATKYGGGGHPKACGCSIASFEVADKLLADLDEIIRKGI